ncbi:hypothetical protein VTL71DRAFT_3420 [Oculimacula yallundae]|uniref:Secreted protein n=1 Tax=Oculimacula yallundae TaxID=86028 RepID=A0ABR4C762_9HELO
MTHTYKHTTQNSILLVSFLPFLLRTPQHQNTPYRCYALFCFVHFLFACRRFSLREQYIGGIIGQWRLVHITTIILCPADRWTV